uniref:Uncharacterized protein n=1 Tax=Strigamia maritima TaxID=126957 RepID=T1ILV1_STRMM
MIIFIGFLMRINIGNSSLFPPTTHFIISKRPQHLQLSWILMDFKWILFSTATAFICLITTKDVATYAIFNCHGSVCTCPKNFFWDEWIQDCRQMVIEGRRTRLRKLRPGHGQKRLKPRKHLAVFVVYK